MFDIKINGKSVRQHTHQGNVYVEGREGTEYSISMQNNFGRRRLFVISVDGINVISGKPATEDDQNGYVVNAYSNLNLKGFRLNDNDVAAFKFVKSSKSYAKERTGSTANNGVIGIKIFEEKTRPLFVGHTFPTYGNGIRGHMFDLGAHPKSSWNPVGDNLLGSSIGDSVEGHNVGGHMGSPCGDFMAGEVERSVPVAKGILRSCNLSAEVKAPEFNLGTGWGSKQDQAVTSVEFEVGRLSQTDVLYYASKEELEAMGIDLGNKPKIRQTMPAAFGEHKYCPTPSGWIG